MQGPHDKLALGRLCSRRALIAAAIFGVAGWLVLAVELFVPIMGTQVNADPHEIFVTLGSAFTGPVGSLIVALIAESGRPRSASWPIIVLGHLAGGLWMGFSYKLLVYRRLTMPLLLAGWAGLVLAYYCLFLFPFIYLLAAVGALPPELLQIWQTRPWLLYLIALRSGAPEALFTTLITTIIIAALPPKYRRPLW